MAPYRTQSVATAAAPRDGGLVGDIIGQALRAAAVIGIAEPGTLGEPPADRLVIHATDDELVLLRQLLGEPRLLRYGADRLSHRDEPFELARALAHTHEHALAILDPDLPGAIAVALDGRPRLRLRPPARARSRRPRPSRSAAPCSSMATSTMPSSPS